MVEWRGKVLGIHRLIEAFIRGSCCPKRDIVALGDQ